MGTKKKVCLYVKSNKSKSVIFQNVNHVLSDNGDTGNEQAIFNVGANSEGSFPIKESKFYEFKLILFLKDLMSYSKVYFSMLGNKEMTDNVAYVAISRLIFDPSVDGNVVGCAKFSFDKTLLNRQEDAVGDGFLIIEGSFQSNGNGFLIPAISFDAMTGEDKVLQGSRFTLKEVKTTSDIV
jgi:hypothetical protein